MLSLQQQQEGQVGVPGGVETFACLCLPALTIAHVACVQTPVQHPLTHTPLCTTHTHPSLPRLPCVVLLAGASSSPPQLQYWYSRAHRALKQRASEPAQLLREYQHVTALDASIGHGVGVARSRAAAGRNRYGNVLPYDHNRCVCCCCCHGCAAVGVEGYADEGKMFAARVEGEQGCVSKTAAANVGGETQHHIPFIA